MPRKKRIVTIALHPETYEALKRKKIIPRESFNEVVRRLLGTRK
jgi:predicted CopG family antitoxin